MNTFGINTFRSVKDGICKRTEFTWDDFADVITSEHDISPSKESISLFNATRFKSLDEVLHENKDGYREDPFDGTLIVRRRQQNVINVELLILDYDGTLTIDEAIDRFKDYEYAGYTSYGHLQKPGVHKFRLIFPLVRPIPAHKKYDDHGTLIEQGDYFHLSEAIMAFAPACDPAILKPTQPYYIPSAHPDRIHLAKRWRNSGEVLDWKKWSRNANFVIDPRTSSLPRKANGLPNRVLDPEQEFQYNGGIVKACDVKGRLQHVACPFHGDVTGSEFLVRYPDSNVVSFHCKRCGTFSLPPIQILPPKLIEALSPHSAANEFVSWDEAYWDHQDRTRVKKFLEEAKKTIMSDKGYAPNKKKGSRREVHFASHILYLPEGAGKSQLALSFLNDPAHQYLPHSQIRYRNQIIFACKSWKQAVEKYQSFAPHLKAIGRTGRIAWSFEGSIFRRFKVKLKRTAARPFAAGEVLDKDSLAEIMQRHPNLDPKFISVTYNILRGGSGKFRHMAIPDAVSVQSDQHTEDDEEFFDDLGPEPPAIIFTTFAQLRLLEVKRDRIPLNWIIWIDDPDIDELIDIKRSGAVNESESPDEKKIALDGTLYDRRAENMSLGASLFRHRCIYTTTERLTLRFLEHNLTLRKERFQVHGERHLITGGKITILGTNYVQKKYDAIVPLLARRLNSSKKKFNVTLIADGIPAEFNHSTNKGRNDLSECNLLVEISQPHPIQIKTVCDALGLNFNVHRDSVGSDLMLDRVHQAIGRNSGYRTKGFECVVLVDKNKHAFLTGECSYSIDTENSVQIDRTAKMTLKQMRISDSASPLVKEIESFLNHVHDYVSDLRKVKPDIDAVISTLEHGDKRFNYIARLLVALTSFSTVRFDLDRESIAQNSLSQRYWELGQWVLETYVAANQRKSVINKYQEEFISPAIS
jgi:hypothetical protein